MQNRKATLQYTLLAALLATTVLFQVYSVRSTLRAVLHPEQEFTDPFFMVPGTNRIGLIVVSTEATHLSRGDQLLKIGETPFTSDSQWGDTLATARVGDVLHLTVRSADGDEHSAVVVVPKSSGSFRTVNLLLRLFFGAVIPVFCMVLAFWVAAVRPRDPLAWLLMALLLGFTQILGTPTTRWSGWISYFGIFYYTALNQTWAIWMMLFGIYFPERFPPGLWRKTATLLKWVLVPPLTLAAIAGIVLRVGGLSSHQAVAGLARIADAVDEPSTILTYIAISTFIVALGIKYKLATSPDVRRRLRLVYLGSMVSLVPALVMSLIAQAKGTSANNVFSPWVVVPCLVLIILFPVTLAYVIVVHKAMDARVVLRQGLQYALAKNGVLALQVIASFVVIMVAATLATDVSRNRPQKIQVIGLGVAVVFLLRWGAERLRGWMDRHFFREAYNAEQILTELSEKVRTIFDPRTLLETVSQRISESLHVSQVAVLVNGSGLYRPAYALGYSVPLNVGFPQDAATVRQLRQENQPARVYLDDPDSWVNRESGVLPEERLRLVELHAELLLPINARDHLLGFISLGQKRSEEPYSGSDLRLLQSVASQTGLALENARLTDAMAKEMVQREKMSRELEIAREVQERLFPQEITAIPGLDYCGACRPALGVGGDYYDFILLAGGKLGIAIGDVSGKGISAALMMASLQASLRGQAMVAPEDLATVVTNVSRLVFEASSSNRYATFFYAQYDPASRQLVYVNAGHNPPLVLHKCQAHLQAASASATVPLSACDCRVEKLDQGGVVVGLLRESPYQQGTIDLQPGDLLVAYTDGISEAMDLDDEEWGEDRMLQCIQSCDGMRAADIIQHVLAAADTFAKGAPQHDDMTLVVARVG